MALRSLFEFLLLSTIVAEIPYDVGGVLSENFSSGLGLALGVTMIAIIGRDSAWMLGLIASDTRDSSTAGATSVLAAALAKVLAVLLVAAYILAYNVVFTISIFAESGALRNRHETSVLCTAALALEIFALSFCVSTARWIMTE